MCWTGDKRQILDMFTLCSRQVPSTIWSDTLHVGGCRPLCLPGTGTATPAPVLSEGARDGTHTELTRGTMSLPPCAPPQDSLRSGPSLHVGSESGPGKVPLVFLAARRAWVLSQARPWGGDTHTYIVSHSWCHTHVDSGRAAGRGRGRRQRRVDFAHITQELCQSPHPRILPGNIDQHHLA